MTKNITWCLMKNIFQKNIFMKRHFQLLGYNHFKHTDEGYGISPQNSPNIDYREVKSYKQFLNETKTGSHAAASALMETLDVTRENATKAVKNWKIFNSLSTISIMQNDDLLREAGANKSTLRQNMFALADTPSNLKKKIKSIQFINLEINSATPLFQLTASELEKFMFITECDRKVLINYKNRISYLSHRFNYGIYELCDTLCRYKFMFNLPIVKLIKVTELLLDEGGFLANHIINDLLIYRYSISRIEERIKQAKNAGISPIKPWIVRCPSAIIDKAEAELKIRNTILDSSKTLVKYISEQLNCSTESVEVLIKRDPAIEVINIDTLSKLLQLYHNYGYTIEDIYRTSRALHCNVETVKMKYDIWMQHNSEPPSLFLLVTSKKIFNSRLLESKNKNQKS